MFLVAIICSDEECADVIEVRARTLDEVDALACACGCTWQVLSVSEVEDVEISLAEPPMELLRAA